jgi:hypothetical protein
LGQLGGDLSVIASTMSTKVNLAAERSFGEFAHGARFGFVEPSRPKRLD